jgi:hypothetical protein
MRTQPWASAQSHGELGPGLGAELAFGVGADHAARIAQGGHRPHDDPDDQRRFDDAVARGDGDAHGLALDVAEVAVEQAVAQPDQDVSLPFLGPALAGERRVRDALGKGEHDEAQGIVAEGRPRDGSPCRNQRR